MIYSVNYEELSGRINPFVIKRYLKGNGWVPFKTKRNDISIFQYIKDGQFEQVTIPNERALFDYSMALYQAVRIVADVEGRPIEQMLLTLLNPHSDIVKIRIDDPGIEPGNIPFDAAVDLYENARKLIAASARDVLHPRNYHAGRPDDSVQKFVSQCRFGQTEVGSYVVPLVCPFMDVDSGSYEQLTIFDKADECAESLTRKVTRHLIEGIHSIKAAIDSESELEIPVSANFCDAVIGICGQRAEALVDFHAQWSPAVRKNIPSFSSVRLNSDYIAPIKAISKTLKPNQEQTMKILGRVQELKADPLPENRQGGHIKVSYLDEEGKAGVLTAVLDAESYAKAIEAHQKGLYVSLEGTIPEGNRNMDCSAFSIIAD